MRSKPIFYLALGDSISSLRINDLITGSQFYTFQIRNAIRQNIAPCKMISKAIPGETSSNITNPLGFFTNFVPDLVTINIGMNDCNSQAVSVATYTANLNTLINRFKSLNPNVKIILCTPSRTNDVNRTPYIQSYRDAMTSVASSQNVSICYFEQAWTSAQDATYLPSGSDPHPNVAGQQQLFNMVWTVVQSVLS